MKNLFLRRKDGHGMAQQTLIVILVLSLAALFTRHNYRSVAVADFDSHSDKLHGRIQTWRYLESEPFAPSGHFETPFLPDGSIRASNTGILFLYGSDGDMHRSNDGGHMWEALADPAYYAFECALAVSPAFGQDNVLFVGLEYGSDALRLSSDGGRSWRSPAQPVTGPICEIAISPSFESDQTVYAATTASWGQLLASTDGGENWQTITSPGSSRIMQIILSPLFATDQTLYVRLHDQTLWRSKDAGATWSPADEGLGSGPTVPIYDLGIARAGSGHALFAAIAGSLLVTVDGGGTWVSLASITIRSLAVSPDFAESGTIFGIDQASRLVRSTDSGASWIVLLPGATIGSLVLSPNYSSDHTVHARGYYSTSYPTTQFWTSTDGGEHWSLASERIPLGASHRIQVVVSPDFDNDHVAFAYSGPENDTRSVRDNPAQFLRSADGGRSWTSISLPGAEVPLQLAISPRFADDQTVFVASGSLLYKSTSGGVEWLQVGDPLPTTEAHLLEVSPNYASDQTVFLGDYYHGMYRSTDDGLSWTFLVGPFITDLDISPGYPDDPTLFVSEYNTGILRSDDGGDTWTPLSKPTFSPDFRVELSPVFPEDNTLFVGVNGRSDGGAFRSDDRGDTWVDITGGVLTSYVRTVAVSPRFDKDQTVIMGKDFSPLYISEDRGATWFTLRGMPLVDDTRKHKDATIAYDDGLLLPFGSTARAGAVYRYRWPELTLPSRLRFCFHPESAGLSDRQLPLIPDDEAPVPWNVSEDAGWLTVAPLSGTLPATLTLVVDTSGVTETVETELTISVQWSSRQAEDIMLPVRLSECLWVWLPVVMRNEP